MWTDKEIWSYIKMISYINGKIKTISIISFATTSIGVFVTKV